MDTVKELLQILPNHWKDIIKQSVEFEHHLNGFNTFIEEKEIETKKSIDSLFELIEMGQQNLSSAVQSTFFYSKIKDVKVDMPRFLEGMNPSAFSENDDLENFFLSKNEILKTSFSPLDNDSFSFTEVFSVIEKIIEVVFKIPLDIDVRNLKELKDAQLTELKNHLFHLFELLFKVKLQGDGNDSVLTLIDSVANELLDVTQPETLSDYIKGVKDTLPKIKKNSTSVDFSREVNGISIVDTGTEMLDLLEEKMPFIANLFSNVGVDIFSNDTLIEKVKLINDEFSDVWTRLKTDDPIKFIKSQIDFGNQDWKSVLSDFMSIFKIPQDFNWKSIPDVIHFIKNVWEQLMKVLGRIEISGINWKDEFSKLNIDISEWLTLPKLDAYNVWDLLYSVLTNIVNSFNEKLNLGPISSFIFEQVKKLHVVVEFVSQSDIKFAINDRKDSTKKSARDVFEVEKNNTVENKRTRRVLKSSKPSITSSATTSTSEEDASINFKEIILTLLTDEENGAISQVDKKYQDVITELIEGDWLSNFFENLFDSYLNMEEWLDLFEDEKEVMQKLIYGKPIPSLGEIMDKLIKQLSNAFNLIIQKAKSTIHFIIKTISEGLEAIIAMLKAIKIPEDWIPQFIKDLLLEGKNPNLLCLGLAIPLTTLKSILNLSSNQLKRA
ncbi:MAG: hypothetical protein HRT58_14240 [Crocinitomicaceae bacterium]|nr:hypothetical protein [Flavobacteriales bacterium]NQZ36825.1 hypothetical protein [Crocinitomicaceae bacterium]